MPINYHLKPENRLAIVVHSGTVSDKEFLSFYKSLYQDSGFDKSFNLLVDLSKAESSARSSSALYEQADMIRKQYADTAAKPRVAVVAPKDLSFGLARMYETFSSEMSWEFAIFRTDKAALDWLGLPEDLMKDID